MLVLGEFFGDPESFVPADTEEELLDDAESEVVCCRLEICCRGLDDDSCLCRGFADELLFGLCPLPPITSKFVVVFDSSRTPCEADFDLSFVDDSQCVDPLCALVDFFLEFE